METMSFLQSLPVWLLFSAIAIPLTSVAWNSRMLARELASTADFEPKTTVEGPLIDNGDGTSTQTISVSVLSTVSGSHTQRFGPISVSANSREWAANAVLLGLFLVFIGLVGMLHFPTGSPFEQSMPAFTEPEARSGGEGQ